MNGPTIFILSTVLLGLCDAQLGPVIGPNSGNGREVIRVPDIVLPSAREVVNRIRRLVPEAIFSAASVPENFARRGLKLASDLIQNIESDGRTAAETFVNNLRAFLAAVFKRIQSLMLRISGLPNATLGMLNRQRRSILTAPMQAFGDFFNSTANSVHNGVQTSITEAMRMFWNFFLTVILPGTHRFLDDLAATQMLPTSMNTMIQNFDMIYGLLKLLGYVAA